MANQFTKQLNALGDPWWGVVYVERLMSTPRRQILLAFTFAILLLVSFLHYYLDLPLPYNLINFFILWLGAFILILLASIFYAESKFNRFYFGGLAKPSIAFEVSFILRSGPKVAKNLFNSVYGVEVAKLLNIESTKWKKLLASVNQQSFSFIIPANFELADLAEQLVVESETIKNFLAEQKISLTDWRMAFTWAVFNNRLTKQRSRWYDKGNLERFVNLTASFRVALPKTLSPFLRPIDEVDKLSDLTTSLGSRHYEVRSLENILGADYRHNVLLQSHSQAAAEEVIREFESLIDRGTVVSPLKGHSLYLLPVAELLVGLPTAEDFIKQALGLFRTLLSTSRLILVIDDLPLLLSRALSLKVSLPKLFKQILNSHQVSFIVLSHSPVEAEVLKAANLMEYFKTVIVADVDEEALYRMLWYKLWSIKRYKGLQFTVQAVKSIVEKAKLDDVRSLQDSALRILSQTLTSLDSEVRVVEQKHIV